MVDENEDFDDVHNYLTSEQFRVDFSEQVTRDTWGKGLPKIYMNDDGDIVEHWENGTINILRTKEELKNKLKP